MLKHTIALFSPTLVIPQKSRARLFRGRHLMMLLAFAWLPVSGFVDYTKIDLPITPSFNASTNQKVYLISFAHGEVHERNQNYLALSAINKGIDVIISYRKRHIDQEFYQQNKSILDAPRGVGYWLWKPYFILETLKKMAPNDILIYADSGIYFTDYVEPIFDMLNNPDTNILLFNNFHTNRRFVKRDAFDIMGIDYKHRDDMQLNACILVIKNTQASYDFIEKWLKYCCIEQAITDTPSQAPEFEDFREHQHDQALLTLTHIKYPDPTIKSLRLPHEKFHHHRRREADKPVILEE